MLALMVAGFLLISPELMSSEARAEENPAGSGVFTALAKKVVPSVVNISTASKMPMPSAGDSPEEFFRRFFDNFFGPGRPGGEGGPGFPFPGPGTPGLPPGHPPVPRAFALGTGFIVDSSGLIVTNNHVVAEADEIKVHFTEDPGEIGSDGEVVGRDPELDIALIQVKSKKDLRPLPLGNSEILEVGEYVLAVGNPFGQGHSVTHGIVSAKGRPSPDFPLVSYIQTDAPINPGNSGGPLINLKGEVIGINNAIQAQAQGIGFAIPANLLKQVLPQLKSKGSVSRGFIGVLAGDPTPEIAAQLKMNEGMQAPFITHVFPNSPAEKAGLKPYDVILELSGKPVRRSTDLIAGVTSTAVGQTVAMKVLREGKEREFQLKIAERPKTPEELSQTGEPKPRPKSPETKTGMTVEELTPSLAKQLGMKKGSKGVIVSSVTMGSPAFEAGIRTGDVILEIDRNKIENVRNFNARLKTATTHLLRIRRFRAGSETYAVIVLDLKKPSGAG